MSFFIRFADRAKELLKFERQSTKNLENTNGSQPSGQASAANINNLSGINTTISNYANYVADAKDAHQILESAQSSLSDIQSALVDMRDLALAGKNTTLTTSLRDDIGESFINLQQSILYKANNTSFQDTNLIDGSLSEKSFKIGPHTSDALNISIGDHTPNGLAVGDLNLQSTENSLTAIEKIDSALNTINTSLANVGSQRTQLDNTLRENNFKFVKLDDTKYRYDKVPITESKLHNVDLQDTRYKYMHISEKRFNSANVSLSSADKVLPRHTIFNVEKLVVILYRSHESDDENSVSLSI